MQGAHIQPCTKILRIFTMSLLSFCAFRLHGSHRGHGMKRRCHGKHVRTERTGIHMHIQTHIRTYTQTHTHIRTEGKQIHGHGHRQTQTQLHGHTQADVCASASAHTYPQAGRRVYTRAQQRSRKRDAFVKLSASRACSVSLCACTRARPYLCLFGSARVCNRRLSHMAMHTHS